MKRSLSDTVAPVFPWNQLFLEMQWEIRQHMITITHSMLARTCTDEYKLYPCKSTVNLLQDALQVGNFYLFRYIEDYYGHLYSESLITLLQDIIKYDQPTFMQDYLSQRYDVRSDADYLAFGQLCFSHDSAKLLCDMIGSIGSAALALIFIKFFPPDDTNIPQIIIRSACIAGNITLLRTQTFYIPDRTEAEYLLHFSFASKCEQVVKSVADLYHLTIPLPDINESEQIITSTPRLDCPNTTYYTVSYLNYMCNMGRTPTTIAVICDAIMGNDIELLHYALDDVGCKVENIERILYCIRDDTQRDILDYLFSKNEHFEEINHITILRAPVTQFGLKYFIDKGLLTPQSLRLINSSVTPDIILWLYELGFILEDNILLHSIIRNDIINIAPMIFTKGVSLARLCIHYKSHRCALHFYRKSLITMDDMIKVISDIPDGLPILIYIIRWAVYNEDGHDCPSIISRITFLRVPHIRQYIHAIERIRL
jgi:hypothetical protein